MQPNPAVVYHGGWVGGDGRGRGALMFADPNLSPSSLSLDAPATNPAISVAVRYPAHTDVGAANLSTR